MKNENPLVHNVHFLLFQPFMRHFVPVISQERFASLCGFTTDKVRGMVEKRNVPTLLIGKHRVINNYQLFKQALQRPGVDVNLIGSVQLDVPMLPRKRFSQLSGISEGVLRGWISNGYIPSFLIGKTRFISLLQLIEMCERGE